METIKKSRWYFPNTEGGLREYEKQWEGDKQFGPITVPTVGLPFDWKGSVKVKEER